MHLMHSDFRVDGKMRLGMYALSSGAVMRVMDDGDPVRCAQFMVPLAEASRLKRAVEAFNAIMDGVDMPPTTKTVIFAE